MTDTDAVVIGGGAVGLACAAALARRGQSVVILERGPRIAEECTARNSGVIHAGLYYAPGSLKALCCREGRERLYARAERELLPHRKLGKLIVAVDESERPALEALYARGLENGAGALRLLDGKELHALEPALRAVAALLSPESGIVDPTELAASYLREARTHGAELVLRAEVVAVEAAASGLRVITQSGDERASLVANAVVNAAGLGAQTLAAHAGLDVEALGFTLYPCKGDYFALGPRLRGLVSRLVYPLPSHAGLGVHLTLDLGGGLRAGPDTEYVHAPRYDVDPDKRQAFASALQRYVPEVRADDLEPDYAGVRPKLQGPRDAPRDFAIHDHAAQGLPGLWSLFGIESPGLTASEALAERVAVMITGA
jgi:L-2-hydroxyglutarate oxidase LhgO